MDAFNSERLPVFRAPCESDGRMYQSTDEGGGMLCPIWNTSPFLGLHAKATGACTSLRTRDECPNPRTQKKLHGQGTDTYTSQGQTPQLLDRIGQVGRFGEKHYQLINVLIKEC